MLWVSAARADSHPSSYIDKGACPFECCTYRAWKADAAAKLHAEPDVRSRIVGVAKPGATVQALTGEVHSRPGRVEVKRDQQAFRAGDVLWVYTYLGEGFFKTWHQGKFVEAQFDFDDRERGADDWARFELMPQSVWWVKVKARGGAIGWSNHPERFSNKDACG